LSCSPETALQAVANCDVSAIFIIIICHCIVIIAADIIKLKTTLCKTVLDGRFTSFQVLLQNAQRTALREVSWSSPPSIISNSLSKSLLSVFALECIDD